MKIWTGKLKRNGPRNTEGPEVDAKIVIGDSGMVLFETKHPDAESWLESKPSDVYAPSWLRALAETGQEVP